MLLRLPAKQQIERPPKAAGIHRVSSATPLPFLQPLSKSLKLAFFFVVNAGYPSALSTGTSLSILASSSPWPHHVRRFCCHTGAAAILQYCRIDEPETTCTCRDQPVWSYNHSLVAFIGPIQQGYCLGVHLKESRDRLVTSLSTKLVVCGRMFTKDVNQCCIIITIKRFEYVLQKCIHFFLIIRHKQR